MAVDLFLGLTLGSITHDSKINWLEVSETVAYDQTDGLKMRLNDSHS